jgi:ferric-dicitrate binding protein FerR (iron transport regulator)
MTPTPEDVSSAGERNSPPWEQLDRYIMGEATIAERKEVERWVETSPEGRQIVAHLKAVVQGEGEVRLDAHAGVDVRARIERILSAQTRSIGKRDVGRLTERDSQKLEIGKAQVLRGRALAGLGGGMLRKWAWASGATVAAICIFLFGRPHVSGEQGVTQTYTTRIGQRAIVTLRDGTRVTLAPQTTLRLAQFGTQSRSVALEGEAYFEVTRAAGAPFVVRSGSLTTRVLGTRFVVRHYPEDAHAHVSVLHGKTQVSVPSSTHAPVTLTAGYVADAGDSTITIKADRNVVTETRWMQGELLFHDTPLPEVLATLHRWYGYQFHCTDPALTRQVITVVLSTQSPAASLAILEQVLSVNLTMVGDTVTLTRRPVQPAHGGTRVRTYDVWTPNREAGR